MLEIEAMSKLFGQNDLTKIWNKFVAAIDKTIAHRTNRCRFSSTSFSISVTCFYLSVMLNSDLFNWCIPVVKICYCEHLATWSDRHGQPYKLIVLYHNSKSRYSHLSYTILKVGAMYIIKFCVHTYSRWSCRQEKCANVLQGLYGINGSWTNLICAIKMQKHGYMYNVCTTMLNVAAYNIQPQFIAGKYLHFTSAFIFLAKQNNRPDWHTVSKQINLQVVYSTVDARFPLKLNPQS